MSNGDIFYDGVVNDLDNISDKLGSVVFYKKEETEKIESMRKNIGIVKDYWKSCPQPLTGSTNFSLASGAELIHEFCGYINSLRPEDFTGATLGTVVDSGDSIVSAGSTLFYIAPPSEPIRKELEVKFIEIKNAPQRKERRKEVKLYLEKIAPHLVNMYDGAWENLDTTFSDPARGAAFMMREVVSQVLDSLAPKGTIKRMPDFIPDPKAKDGVTRRHRLEYIATHKAKDNFNKELIEKSVKSFLDIYEALCDAHKRESLDKSEIESFLLQADDLLILLLSAVKID